MRAADAPEQVERAGRGLTSLEGRLARLPDTHPASPRYSRADRVPEVAERADDIRPLTDAEHAEHVAEVRSRLDEAHKAGLSTDHVHTVDVKHKVWSDERDALHDEIVADFFSRASDVPRENRAILAGGLPGSGKTTVLTELAGIDLRQYMMINPDEIKEEMARRGLIPEVEGLSPMEASDLVHEETSRIAKRLAHRAQGEGVNLIWDVTMSEEPSTRRRLDSLRTAGYTQVDGIFVGIPIDVSVRRADARYREGQEDFRIGEGFGGRYVPDEVIVGHSDEQWGSQNRRTFESLKDRFDAWSRFDNSMDGRPAVIVEASDAARSIERKAYDF